MDIAHLPGERWWGGCVADAPAMPYLPGFARRIGEMRGNQAQPLLVSSRGRWLWSDAPFSFACTADGIAIGEADAPIASGATGGGLREASRAAAAAHFPPSGRLPHPLLFTRPQYNTWIELQYGQNQTGVLAYAERLVAEGYPPGVLMIDDSWQQDYGDWRFAADRFPDPAAMVAQLHRLGFAVMLWLSPHVSPDGRLFLDLRERGLLLRDAAGEVAIRRWWNGHSALLDIGDPAAAGWLRAQLAELQRRTGIDGFKFDGGDAGDYRADDRAARPGPAVEQSMHWAAFAEGWELNELRACWRQGNRPLAQRLSDKRHDWGPAGLGGCLPGVLAQAVLGHPFSCPDMIGAASTATSTPPAAEMASCSCAMRNSPPCCRCSSSAPRPGGSSLPSMPACAVKRRCCTPRTASASSPWPASPPPPASRSCGRWPGAGAIRQRRT